MGTRRHTLADQKKLGWAGFHPIVLLPGYALAHGARGIAALAAAVNVEPVA